jgi:uncharacterized protein YcaQ
MSQQITLARLRAYATVRSLSRQSDLEGAIRALGFVQLDPIRAPARAQDLILRHRVAHYRNGELDRRYTELPLAEEHLHVYGVLPRDAQPLLHPRLRHHRWHVEREHPRLAARILAHIGQSGPTHPRDLQRALGAARIVNGWGGQSSATTRMLEVMHYRGLLRVSHREKGIRIYDVVPPWPRELTPAARATELVKILVRLYAPLPEASLRTLSRLAMAGSIAEPMRLAALARLAKEGWLAGANVDGVPYVWPAEDETTTEADDAVRLLAPFDPLVWDRKRFEQLWGWAYRFEAYTPPAKRRLGYYALPLLWRDAVIGWANAALVGGALEVETGFVGKRPRDAAFRRELDAEIHRMSAFLGAPVAKVIARY